MEPITTFLSIALGYILKGAAQSKTAEKAKDELLDGFWQWIRPLFLEDGPDMENQPGTEATEAKAGGRLLELVQDEPFFEELARRVAALQQAGIREKNIVRSDITRVKKIRIGDKVYDPNDTYHLKNIVEGNISDTDEFILGDGH